MATSSTDRRPAPFVTFYSFKGGVGRSMALINVAGILAGRGFRVLAIDLDLEAPGISYLVPAESSVDTREARAGFVELLADAVARGGESDLFALDPREVVERYSGLFKVPEPIQHSAEGYLRIMSAGRFDGGYQRRLDDLNLPGLYRDGRGQELIGVFKSTIQDSNSFDVVLVDSRTGFSDESGICTRDLADHLMVVTGLNRQNVEGTAEFLRVLRLVSEGPKSLRIILSPVPTGEDDLVDQREKIALQRFAEAWGEEVDLSLQIPYHPRLALTEEPHIFRRSRGYLFHAYVAIEEELLTNLGFTAAAFIDGACKCARSNRYSDAVTYLKDALKLDGGHMSLNRSLDELVTPSRWDPEAKTLHSFLAKEMKAPPQTFLFLANRLREVKNESARFFLDRALDMAPHDSSVLSAYALFLDEVRADYTGAEHFYRRACDADIAPGPNRLGNHAKVLFILGRQEEAVAVLTQAFAALEPDEVLTDGAVSCELHFYAYAHAWQTWPEALGRLKYYLCRGGRSKDWDLTANVERAREQRHPAIDLVATLAQVISEGARMQELEQFPAWNETPPHPPEES